MSGNIRQQLIEALQLAEDQALEAGGRIVGGNWDVSQHHRRLAQVVERGALIAENLPNEIAAHIARWDPSTVLRLIERDRALAAHYWRVVDSVEEADSTTGRTIRRVMAETLAPEFERLTAFWLGTPEVDR